MDRILKLSALIWCSCGLVMGCGQSPAGDKAASGDGRTAAPPLASAALNPANDPIVRAAEGFLEAVLKGDAQRAAALLSPAAMERIVERNEQFNPPGFASASFRIGEVRRSSESQALVQCILMAASESGQPQEEEMCCLMRLVEKDWRVSGIAFSEGPNMPPTIMDFEAGTTLRQSTGANRTADGRSPGMSRPSPAPMEQQSPTPIVR
jgi:hypothetical protein